MRGHPTHRGRCSAATGSRAQLVSLHEHNEDARARQLVRAIRAGEVVALVSDAGTPLVSDPGFALVRGCLAAGLAVEVLPGPSAVLVALVASGLPAERWRFVGFLPRKGADRERLLLDGDETLVAFESPRRLPATLALLAARDPQRPVAVCRELTKLHEEVAAAARQSWRRTSPRPAARRDRAGRRRRARRTRGRSATRSPRCASWSTPERGRARRPPRWPG